ncbi:MAG: [LysW]-lysine hydrolase [Candidatus Diapherotrites archaeon]|nr:[LysW]-lysine hydrolase [Candidatus Diapherotrites archaeon]
MQLNKEQELLKEMLEIYSPSLREEKLADFLLKKMKKLGFSAHKDEVGNPVGILGSGEKEILLVGHIDTVEGEIPVRVENENLFGRGSVDAKAPMACYISAVARFAGKKLDGWKIIIVGAVCEEIAGKDNSKGARNLLGKYSPNYILIGEPSSWDAITLGYKGALRVLFSLEQEKFHGAHKGLNALEKSVQFYNSVREFAETFNQGKQGFEQLEMRLEKIENNSTEFVEKIVLKLRFRLPVDFNSKDLKNFLESIKDSGKIDFADEDPAIRVPKSGKLVSAFIKAIRSEKGEPRFKSKSGTSDMNVLGPHYKCQILAFGPGDSALDHTPNEHISLKEFDKSVNVLEKVLQELLKS